MNSRLRGYVFRFSSLHLLTYAVIGIVFMTLQDYEAAFAVQEQFEVFFPLDDPLIAAALPVQIIRGGLPALLLYPFALSVLCGVRGEGAWMAASVFGAVRPDGTGFTGLHSRSHRRYRSGGVGCPAHCRAA